MVLYFSRCLVFFLLLLFLSANFVLAEVLSIKGNNVHVRTGPGKKYGIACEYGSGFPVQVVGKKGNWLKIKDFENDVGWVHNSLVDATPQVIVKANKNKDEKINIRKGPGSDRKIVGKAYYGVVFKVLRQQSDWVEVQHESGLTGWVYSRLLWGIQ
jgi:SH3-like domain-containing protein